MAIKDHESYKRKAENQIEKLENKILELKKLVKKQQGNIVKPLMMEVKIQSELLERQKL